MEYNPATSPLYKMLLRGANRQLPKKQVTASLGDRSMLNLIESGFIKRYRITHEGGKSIQLIYGPNDVFPLTPLLEAIYGIKVYRGPETYYYECMTDVSVYSISVAELRAAIGENPQLYKDVLYAAATRLNTYIARKEEVSLRAGSWRIAFQLVHLAEQFGQASPDGLLIPFALTHQDLADILDLTRETVSREMTKLKHRDLVRGSKLLTIPDIAALRALYHA